MLATTTTTCSRLSRLECSESACVEVRRPLVHALLVLGTPALRTPPLPPAADSGASTGGELKWRSATVAAIKHDVYSMAAVNFGSLPVHVVPIGDTADRQCDVGCLQAIAANGCYWRFDPTTAGASSMTEVIADAVGSVRYTAACNVEVACIPGRHTVADILAQQQHIDAVDVCWIRFKNVAADVFFSDVSL